MSLVDHRFTAEEHYRNLNKMKIELSTDQEVELRQKLIDLGWTPPPEKKKEKWVAQKHIHNSLTYELINWSGNVFNRETQEQAQRLSDDLRRYARLSAFVDEIGGRRAFVEGESNWVVEYYSNESTYLACCYHNYKQPTTIYMTKEVADQVCQMLNSGELEL